MEDAIVKTLEDALMSPNEFDRNGEIANVVDGLFAIARAIHALARSVESLQKITIDKLS